MLCLSRRTDQSIVFPGLGIAIKINRIKNGTVSLGIVAPREVMCLREELLKEAEMDARHSEGETVLEDERQRAG